MRVFCNITPALNITRRISCNYNARQYTSLVQIVQCNRPNNNGTIWSTNNTLRKFHNEDKPVNKQPDKRSENNEVVKDVVDTSGGNSILPVALIDLNPLSSTSTKILLFPLNLTNGSEATIKNTLTSIFSQRRNLRQIEAFSNALSQMPEFQQNQNPQTGEKLQEHNADQEIDQSLNVYDNHGTEFTELEKEPVLTVLEKPINLSLVHCHFTPWGNLFGLPENFSKALQNFGFIVGDKCRCSSVPDSEHLSDKSYIASGDYSCERSQPLSLSVIMKSDDLKLNFEEFIFQRKLSFDPLNLSTRSFCTTFIVDARNKSEIKIPKIYKVQDPLNIRFHTKSAVKVTLDSRHISNDSSSTLMSQIPSQSSSVKVTVYDSPFVSELLGGQKYPMSCDTYRKALVEAVKRRAALKGEVPIKRLKDCTPNSPTVMTTGKTPVLAEISDSSGKIAKNINKKDDTSIEWESLKSRQTGQKDRVSPKCECLDCTTKLQKSPCKKASSGDNVYLEVYGMPQLSLKHMEPVLQMSNVGVGKGRNASTSGTAGKGSPGGKDTPAGGKGTPAGGKGKSRKPSPCADTKTNYKPKCNTDPCSNVNDPCKKPTKKSPESDTKKGPCAKMEDKKKSDCCVKKEDKMITDPCAKKDDKKKSATCAKKDDKKKSSACAKKDDKKKSDTCAKKDDKTKSATCAKKDDKKKSATCAKKDDKKKSATCAKKDDKTKSATCAKKDDKTKSATCAKKDDKKKSDTCAKKETPKSRSCSLDKKKSDSCTKKIDKKTTDPCAKKKDDKNKSDPCAKKDAKKQSDPCAKKKDDKNKSDPCAKKVDKKTSDACVKKEKKANPCAKDDKKKPGPCDKKESKKTDPCGKDKKKVEKKKSDSCLKKDEKKKTDPCAKYKKQTADPCAKQKKTDSKEQMKIYDPCAKKEKKTSAGPCGAKQEKKQVNICGKQPEKPSNEQDKKIFDPCGKKQKKTANPCAKKQKAAESKPTKKCFSTTAIGQSQFDLKPKVKYYSTLALNTPKIFSASQSKIHFDKKFRNRLLNNNLNSFGFMRRFSSKGKKGEEKIDLGVSSKCKSLATKKPPNRKKNHNPHPKDGLRKCYPAYDMECPRKLCKDPKTTACSKYAFLKDTDNSKRKENKNSVNPPYTTHIDQKKCLHLDSSTSSAMPQQKRKFHTTFEWRRNFFPKDLKFLQETDRQTQMSAHELYDNDECYDDEKGKSSQTHGLFNEALIIQEAYKVERVIKDVPHFSDYDVLVSTSAVAISGSDIHIYENGSDSCPDISLGHDAAGVVVKTGQCITELKPGDRVTMEPSVACGICEFCKSGDYNMCRKLLYNGFFMNYQAHPADLCHKIPDTISMAEAALSQTLALGCQAVSKTNITPTTNILVMGSGPTAVATAFCAHAKGAKDVAVMCTMREALESMRDNLSLKCVHYKEGCNFQEVLEAIFNCFNEWPDVVVNCAINEETMNIAAMALKPCGTCVLAQCDTESASFNALDVLMKNIKLVPSFRSANMFPTAINLMSTGCVPMSKIIASSVHWDHVAKAFRSAQHESNCGYKKVIVECGDEDEASKN